jgi:hypothetical protein
MTGNMSVVQGYGYGKTVMDKAKSMGIWTFMSMSPKLAWINGEATLVTLEGDPQWMEFTVTVWEWKWRRHHLITFAKFPFILRNLSF